MDIRKALLRWYDRNRRDLPWRHTRDPYAIWISEVMAQQTRISVVVGYYERFLKRFPTLESLARARIDTVLRYWSGLGYYRRARSLHEAARQMRREGIPTTVAGWRALPGVGAYTAAAVASICFDAPAAVVDGNVERVVCRFRGWERGAGDVPAEAQTWLDRRRPGDHNQAMMELGATVCTPRAPDCGSCPLRRACAGREAPERYPGPKKRAAMVDERVDVALVRSGPRVLLRQVRNRRRLEGLWELPPGRGRGTVLGTVRHTVMNRRQTYAIRESARRGDVVREGEAWFTRRKAEGAALTAAARKCLNRVGFLRAAGSS